MAKFGEGDKRWIVSERQDGRNVSNYHWTEKDCLPWSQRRLGELLSGLQLLQGEGGCWAKTTTLDSCKGDAYINIRKGKMIPGYELDIKVAWEGEVRDGEGTAVAHARGQIEIPYLADENADEDPEVKVTVAEGAGPAGVRLQQAVVSKGRPIVVEALKVYVKEFAAGGAAKDEVKGAAPLATPSKQAAAGAGGSGAGVSASGASSKAREQVPEVKKGGKAGTKRVALSQKFYCRPRDVYEALLDEGRVRAFTQSAASIAPEKGRAFSLFDGAVTGVVQDLVPNEVIVQKWRFSNWPDGVYSTVCLTLEEPTEGTTIVKLTQTDIPEEDRYGNGGIVESVEHGWRELIFQRIRVVFGYGA